MTTLGSWCNRFSLKETSYIRDFFVNMKRFCFISSLCILFVLPMSTLDEISPSRRILQFLLRVGDSLRILTDDTSEAAYKMIAEREKTQPVAPKDIPFPCTLTEARSRTKPTNVNEVRPGDIDIIGAIGDSLTAANGAAATNLLQVTREHRGLSWSIGGQGTWHKFLTLPNILKEFNPNLIGFSGATADREFNAALAGTGIKDLFYLAKALVNQITSDPRVDILNDWKLITIMIGANDFCSNICFLGEEGFQSSPELLRQRFTLALDYLRDNLPRTIVNVVPPPILEPLSEYETARSYCRTLISVQCPCIFGQMRVFSLEENFEMQRKWQRIQEELAMDEKYRTPDFLIVAQPFSEKLTFPQVEKNGRYFPDTSWFTEDCFHLSQKGHASAANALWNNMLEPIGQKTREWYPPFERFICPTQEYPFIFSYENSPNHTIELHELSLE